ncbi:hypothetical protein ACFR9U_21075 [Halorientalis brevis]|uniref:Uncharacterized protein n=2 Tax=Halorientalis brevis TaxID=1126241 RepID=A0ABD6CHP6_9EURY|nr:hypothetical protein [Halorientalis brevis]
MGWFSTGVVALAAIESVRADALLWGVFSVLVAIVVSIPALTTGEWTAMVPWPLVSVAAVAVTARAVGVSPDAAGYLAIAMLALVIVVELDAFTSIELGRRFAVVFGVLTAMAIEALWIIAQFYSDRWLGTDFLSTQTELQLDIVSVTVMSVVVGSLVYWYLVRFESAGIVDRSAQGVKSE